MENNVNKLSEIIGNSVVFYRPQIVDMLNKNGVTINAETYNTEMLVDAVVNGLSTSQSFVKDFEKLVSTNGEYLNGDGDGDATGSYITAGAGVVTGLINLFGGNKQAKEQAKAVSAQAKATAKNAESQVEIAKINQQTELLKLQALQGKGKSNTGLYIGLGVGGVLILGLVVFLAVKK